MTLAGSLSIGASLTKNRDGESVVITPPHSNHVHTLSQSPGSSETGPYAPLAIKWQVPGTSRAWLPMS